MTFKEVLAQVIDWLQQDQRISYRALKRQFDLDDAYLDDLKRELIEVKQCAIDHHGSMLVWSGSPAAAPTQGSRRVAEAELRFHTLLAAVMWLLQRDRRITYRTLMSSLDLDAVWLEEIRAELLFRQVARDEQGEGLVWTGEAQSAMPSAVVDMPPSVALDTHAVTVSVLSPEPTHPAPEAERRQLTVMFCDLADSTRLAQQLDPEDLREVIRAYHATAVAVVQRFAGYPAQYLGDGLLIYLGWPQAHEDDAQRAVYTGLGIVEAITTELNPRLQPEKDVQLAVRVGIHTGPVVVGAMGGAERQEHLATGDTVNIAARLEGLAAPNTVVLSQVTARLVQPAFVLEELGRHTLKGVAEPMRVFRVLRPLPVPGDEEGVTSACRRFLVGRDEEVGLLLRRWEQSKAGLGQVVLLGGEAGIGKSAMVETLRAQVRQEGFPRIAYRCSPYHTNSALYPVIEQVQRICHIQPDDTPEAKLVKLEQTLRAYSFPLKDVVPLLATLLSVPLTTRYAALTLSPQQMKQQTQDMLVAWLLEEAERHPVLAVWEDLHWADPSTLELLGVLIEQAPTAAMLHVLTFRPEFTPPWPNRAHVTPLTLNRLERPQVEAIVGHLAGDKRLPPEVIEHIISKTDGVPLYIEELTKMLLESSLLHEEGEHYTLSGPLSAVPIPATLQDSLMARLDQLNRAKDIAQLGAVVGREFTYDMVQMLAGVDEATLQDGLTQLVHAELLYQRGRPPRAKYLFKHALIQDTAYQTLLKSTRQQVHQQVAQLLEERFPETVERQPELVAHHYTAAGLYAKAVAYWKQAGHYATDRSAYREATAHFEEALDALQYLPENRDIMEQAVDLRFELRNALLPLGEKRILDCLYEAEGICETLNDHSRLGRVHAYLARYFFGTGDHERAVLSGQRALDLAASLHNFDLQVTTQFYLGVAYHSLGDYARSIEILRQNIASIKGTLLYEHFGLPYLPSVFSRNWLVWCMAERGEFAEGIMHGEEGVRIAETSAQPWDLMAAYRSVGLLYLYKGEFDQTIPLLKRCLELCQQGSLFAWLPLTASTLGAAYIQSGRVAEAIPLLEQGVDQVARELAHLSLRVGYLSKGYLLVGRIDEAIQLAEHALKLSCDRKERGYQAWALRLLGEIHAQPKSQAVDQAEAYYQQALTLATELGMRPLQAHCHLGFGTLYSQTERVEQARAALTTAIELYRAMGMTFWLPQAEGALARLR